MEKIAIAVFQQRNTLLGFTKHHVRIVSKTLHSKYFYGAYISIYKTLHSKYFYWAYISIYKTLHSKYFYWAYISIYKTHFSFGLG